jgi:hypothetical protein|tara:strand:- start:426 stop:563 length:138 start_codon:yes stop_codon:yes gene_type:complete
MPKRRRPAVGQASDSNLLPVAVVVVEAVEEVAAVAAANQGTTARS